MNKSQLKVMSFMAITAVILVLSVWQYLALDHAPPNEEMLLQRDRALLHDSNTQLVPENEDKILAALVRLGDNEDPVVVSRVQEWVEHPSEAVRLYMARSITVFYDSDERVPVLLRRLFDVGGESVKRQVIDSIGASASESRLRHLEELIAQSSVDDRLKLRAYAWVGELQMPLLEANRRRAHVESLRSKAQEVLTAQNTDSEELRDLLRAFRFFGVDATPELKASVDQNLERLGSAAGADTKATAQSWAKPQSKH